MLHPPVPYTGTNSWKKGGNEFSQLQITRPPPPQHGRPCPSITRNLSSNGRCHRRPRGWLAAAVLPHTHTASEGRGGTWGRPGMRTFQKEGVKRPVGVCVCVCVCVCVVVLGCRKSTDLRPASSCRSCSRCEAGGASSSHIPT